MNEDTAEQNIEKLFVTYYPSDCREANGHLHMRTSHWTRELQSIGTATITPSNPDYELWLWVIPRLLSTETGRINHEDIEKSRPAFEQERQQAVSDALFREQLLTDVPICPRPTVSERIAEATISVLGMVFAIMFFGPMFVVDTVVAPFKWAKRFWQRSRKRH